MRCAGSAAHAKGGRSTPNGSWTQGGYFDDPGDRLGFLDMQGFRAARVIVDTRVDLGPTIPADNPYGLVTR